ncbi:MAG: hypothetical protein ACXVA9_11590 [Bdellovibrionales bacterium]
MRQQVYVLCFLFLSAVSTASFAETSPAATAGSENKMSITDAAAKKNKVDGDIDNEITNPKLRADSGSKSKFSMSSVFSYTGGALSSPFAADRPNLAGLPENQVESSINGSLKTRYRSTKNSSYTLGVGLGVQTPFEGRVNNNENQINIGDPVVGYNYIFPALGLQHSMDFTGTYATSNESLRVDQTASVGFAYNMVKAFQSGLNLGLNATSYYNLYDNRPGATKFTAIKDGDNRVDSRTAWAATFSPVVEYHFNDQFSFRTLFAYARWRHLYGDRKNWSMIHSKEYQSVGVGIALNRDVYLYPNVQFLPLDIRSDYTNFGISSSINVF